MTIYVRKRTYSKNAEKEAYTSLRLEQRARLNALEPHFTSLNIYKLDWTEDLLQPGNLLVYCTALDEKGAIAVVHSYDVLSKTVAVDRVTSESRATIRHSHTSVPI